MDLPAPPRLSPALVAGLFAFALMSPCLTFWILWIAPIEATGTDRVAMAARDFSDLWAAGRLASARAFDILYNPAGLTGFLRDTFGPNMPAQIWPYPPTTLLLAALVGSVPLPTGFMVYTAASLVLLAWSVWRCASSIAICAAILLSPAVAENMLAGQNGALTAAALIGGLLCVDTRPRLAGVLLGLLVLKPQFGLLLPLCLISGRHWKVLSSAAITALAIATLSGLWFGPEAWTGFLLHARPETTAYFEAPWTGSDSQRMFSSVFMAARSLGADLATAYAAQGLTSLFAAGLVWKLWRRPNENARQRLAVTLIAILAASPWVHGYDMPALAAAIALLFPTTRPQYRLLLAIAWLWPGMLSLLPLPAPLPALSLLSMLTVASQVSLAIRQGRKKQASMRVVHLFLTLIVLLIGRPAFAIDVAQACDAAAARAERQMGVPSGVLAAVGTVESGRSGPWGSAPWPWTINAAGHGQHFATKQEAIAAVLMLMAKGYPAIDIGCFQVDILYHAGVFRSLEDAFDPERNAQEAARILMAERSRGADWPTSVAHYHSANPEHGAPYLQRVRAALPASRVRANAADFLQNLDDRRAGDQPSFQAAVPLATRTLPRVIYILPLGSNVKSSPVSIAR